MSSGFRENERKGLWGCLVSRAHKTSLRVDHILYLPLQGVICDAFSFPFGVGQVFFSKLLLENIKPGAFFEWCKINRGAFVVARYVYGRFYLPSHSHDHVSLLSTV